MSENPTAIFINIHCEDKKEAQKLGGYLVKNKLCGYTRITENVHLIYKEKGEVKGDGCVLMTIKTTPENLEKIEIYIYKNHSWGTPCVDVVPIVTDHC